MQTTVVNIRREACDVYIGRAGKGEDGYFGNPHPVGRICPACQRIGWTLVHAQGDAVEAFRTDFVKRVAGDEEFCARVLGLKGKRLGCFCKPKACHGDVIVEWLEGPGDGEVVPSGTHTGKGVRADVEKMLTEAVEALENRDVVELLDAHEPELMRRLRKRLRGVLGEVEHA